METISISLIIAVCDMLVKTLFLSFLMIDFLKIDFLKLGAAVRAVLEKFGFSLPSDIVDYMAAVQV